jgi:hypothetical protein
VIKAGGVVEIPRAEVKTSSLCRILIWAPAALQVRSLAERVKYIEFKAVVCPVINASALVPGRCTSWFTREYFYNPELFLHRFFFYL